MEDIKIIIDTNAEQAGKSFDDLGKSFENTTNDAEDLRKQIRELKGELFKLTPGTEEYGRVLEQLGSKMNQLGDTTQELRVATGGLDTVFQTTTQATATMAAGFTAATGVVALFGGDTENLQKTFVKLQAVMAITTGLKGFAAFEKMTKRASISLKAYIAQMKLARTATQQQTASTAALTTAEVGATTAATGLSAAIKSVTAAIASNPIGAVLVAITAAITAISSFNNKAKEAAEQTKKWNDVLQELKGSQYTYSSILEQDEAYFNKEINAMKALGASQETINEKTVEYSKKKKEQLIADRDYYEHLIEANKANKELNEQMEKWAEKARECNAEIKELDQTIATLSYKLPQFAADFDSAFSDFDRNLSRKVAQGVITERDAVVQEIDFYNKEISKLEQSVKDFEIALGKRSVGMDENGRQIYNPNTSLSAQEKKQMEQDIVAMNARIEKYNKAVGTYTRNLEDINDRRAKAASAAYKKLMEEQKKNFSEFNKEYDKAYDEMYKAILEFNDKMTELYNSMGFSEEESRGKARNSLAVVLGDINNFTNTWRKKAEELALTNKISSTSFNVFLLDIEKNALRLQDIATHITDDIELTDYAVAINNRLLNSVKYLKEGLTTIDQLRKEGLINEEQYQKAYIEHIEGFKSRMADDAADIEDYFARILSGDPEADTNIDETLAEFLERNELTVQQYVDTLKALFEQSGTVLPPEFAKSITDSLSKIIDTQFKELENSYKQRLDAFQVWQDEQNRSWLEGGKNTSYWGDSASATYQKMQQQADELYKLLHEEYTQEMTMLQEKIALLDENSDAYKTYFEKIEQLRQADADAQEVYQTSSISNIRQYADNIMETAGKFGDAISGLASAMGSYYGEQAEQAKEMYGENSEEYKKYLKKEGNMKIAQVWTDAATGIMTAWATSEQLGPIAGPILAAVQTATLLATATASTMQIKRQTNANASGGDTTANVGQLTDRVIMAEAQNTDQTAQLNASYNQGATRVFVTVDDINNGQNANRTAVTNNTF